MMLDFYGMKLVDKTSGEVIRTKDYKERFANLIRFGLENENKLFLSIL
jgi:hypothetical protein